MRGLTEMPDWAADAVISETGIHLSFWDRLRVLIHGSLSLRTVTLTAGEPGRTQTIESRVSVPRVLPQRRHPGVVAAAPDARPGGAE